MYPNNLFARRQKQTINTPNWTVANISQYFSLKFLAKYISPLDLLLQFWGIWQIFKIYLLQLFLYPPGMIITSHEHECPNGSLSIFSHTNLLLVPNNVSEFFSVVFTLLREADLPIFKTSWLSWTLLMAHSEANMNSNVNTLSPSFRPF